MSTNQLECGKKISVVVPAYNVEKYLERCLDSILEQSYSNLEVIVVDDGSTDGTGKIVQRYMDADERIVSINHGENRGLFQARITGSELATGDYIAFVDSDDYVSFDWYRKLLRKAESSDAEMVVGDWCYSYEGTNSQEYCNLDPFRIQNWNLSGADVLRAFMEQEGRSFSWSVVWNKLYSMGLWKRCYPIFVSFSKAHGHMLMWEDVAFSSVIWSQAKSVANVHGGLYYYCKNLDSATVVHRNRKRLEKYLKDSSAAIRFMKLQLENAGRYEELEKHYAAWNQRWGSMVYRDICIQGGQRSMHSEVIHQFNIIPDLIEANNLSWSLSPLADSFNWLEGIKKAIVDKTVDYISFDVFDTLIERPFMNPTDLFDFLSDELNKCTASYVNFKQIRITSEQLCRNQSSRHNSDKEEITLQEIYEKIEADYHFDHEMLIHLMEKEIELEEYFCTKRAIGKELYELAMEAGKKILICSDMYLSQQTIETILLNNGYTNYHDIFVSSTYLQTKYSINLYRAMLKKLGVKKPASILHIGDNWISDFQNPQKLGMRSGHINKAADVFQNQNEDGYGGNLFHNVFLENPEREDYYQCYKDFPAVRNIFALTANHIYGDPFVSYRPKTAFNGDPNYIGYQALGPHLLAVATWLSKHAAERKIGTIHFVARDGYLVKKAFDILNNTSTKSNYIRVSRKAMVLADVESEMDLYSLCHKIDVYSATPIKLLEYLRPIIPNERWENLHSILKNAGIAYSRPIIDQTCYLRCMRVIIDQCIDLELLPAYKHALKEYFGSFIQPGDYIFDIGYSGRTEAALSNILGFPVGSFYMHTNSDIAFKRQVKYHCPCECFYQYKPSITGVIREHLFMELAPSCIGYHWNSGTVEPIFEEYKPEYDGVRITKLLQESAIQFIEDYKKIFGNYISQMDYQYAIISAPYEYYLHYSDLFDRQAFGTLPFEDDANGNDFISVLNFWNAEIANHHLATCRSSGSHYYDENNWFEGIYPNGLYVRFYRWLNRIFPRGSAMREKIKNIVRLFLH